MKQTPGTSKDAADKLVRGIKRRTRKHYSGEEKIRVVLAVALFLIGSRHLAQTETGSNSSASTANLP